jgi:hypothetical protein
MSNLSDLAASGRSIPELPGITLSPWELHDYGTAEDEFERAHLAKVTGAAYSNGMPPEARDHLIRTANAHISEGNLKYGSRGFDLQLFAPSNVPFMLWISGRAKTKNFLLEDAQRLVAQSKIRNAVHNVLLELAGIDVTRKADGTKGDDKKGEATAPPDSTGPQSTSSSAGAESSAPSNSAA